MVVLAVPATVIVGPCGNGTQVDAGQGQRVAAGDVVGQRESTRLCQGTANRDHQTGIVALLVRMMALERLTVAPIFWSVRC